MAIASNVMETRSPTLINKSSSRRPGLGLISEALIDQRVEEFRQQIAMGRVDLNAGKAGLFGDKGGMGETTDNLVDFLDRQGAGLGEKPAGQGHFARR